MLSDLLDSVYELEGLIHLALNRDTPPETLYSLICRKAEAISAMAPAATASLHPDSMAEEIIAGVNIAEQTDEETESDSEPEIETSLSAYDESISSVVEATPPNDAEETESAPEFIPMETVSPDYELGEEYSESFDFAGSEESSSSSRASAKRGRLVFNLNDRYRFRRSLFHGNDNDFSAALSAAAELASYSDAERYFFSVLGWDSDDEEVKAFMQLLENYYK